MDRSKLAMHLAKASAAAYKAAESIKQFGRAIGPIAKQLQKKTRLFAAAHLELEQQKRDSTEHLRLAMSEQTRPLWEVMDDADQNTKLTGKQMSDWRRYVKASEIRAIADEMVMRFDPWLAEHAEVAEWLRAEASRAELNLQGKPND